MSEEKITVAVNQFTWDGSFLGDYSRKIVKRYFVHRGIKMMELEITGVRTICSYNSSFKTISCIFDEIREYFGLEKMGTHMIRIGGLKYTIYRIKSKKKDGKLVPREIIYLSEISKKSEILKEPDFIEGVRKIFTVKDLCLMSPNSEGKILVYKRNGKHYPVSYVNHVIPDDSQKSNSILSLTTVNNWFNDEDDYFKCMKSCLSFSDVEYDIPLCSSGHNDEMKKIIKRIDETYYWYSNAVAERILLILVQLTCNEQNDDDDF